MWVWLVCAAYGVLSAPNILLCVADDLGYNDVGWHDPNLSVVKTPNLNALAKAGVRLRSHYVQPICSPTRASLMTGRYTLRYGLQNDVIFPQDGWGIPLNETLLARNLKDAGYHTAVMGKWHLGYYKDSYVPMARGFDEQYGFYNGGEDYFTHYRQAGLDWRRNDTLVTSENGTYSAGLLGKAALEFIQRAPEPWFLYLPFQSVHSPMEVPDSFKKRYPHLKGNQQVRAAMVSALDDQMAGIASAIKKTKEPTVLVFTADNGAPYGDAFQEEDLDPDLPVLEGDGAHTVPNGTHGPGGGSNLPFKGWKHYVYEGGVRSSAFVWSPLLKQPGTVNTKLYHAVDWLPTLAGLAGAQTTHNLPLDGRDIWESIQTPDVPSPHTELVVNMADCGSHTVPQGPITDVVGMTMTAPYSAIRVGDWKLIVQCYAGGKAQGTLELYNIATDEVEANNVATKNPDVVQRLLGRMHYWEGQSVPAFKPDPACPHGKPHGTPLAWGPWC